MEATGVHHLSEDSVESWSGKSAGDENFPVASVLIRRDLRPHIHAFYRFARNADDIADSDTLAPDEKLCRLNVMEDVLVGRREHGAPSAAGLRDSLSQTGIPRQHSLDLLRAFRQDAIKTRYASWAELYDYCRYSAMPVGRHVLDLHGEHVRSWAASDALCAVLQVLNHLQDCAKDFADINRCYLPADMFKAAGTDIEDLRGPTETPALRTVFATLLAECDSLNKTASALPRLVKDRRLRLETGVIAALARRLTGRLRRADPIATRVKLSRPDTAFSLISAMRYLP